MDSDLRMLDEKGFKNIYYYLNKQTDQFTDVIPELILENNRYLLILRICLGLSQKEFGRRLGVTKDWCRRTEAGRNKIIHERIADRYVEGINQLLAENAPSFEKALKKWRGYTFAREQDLPKVEINLKTITKMTESDMKEYLELVRKETKGFTEFEPTLLTRIPQSLMVLRVALGIDHRRFAKLLGIGSRTVRKYEHLEMKIKPSTANRLIEIIRDLFKNNTKEISLEKTIENFRIFTGFYGHRNLDSMTNQGLTRLGKTQSAIENKIHALLKKAGVSSERNCIINGINKKYNVDFIIPNISEPKIVIEGFVFKRSIKTHNWKYKVCTTDHRFQALKMKNPNLKTIMVIEFTGRPILHEFTKKCVGRELLNTDHCLINDEIEDINKIVGIYY